MTLKKVLLVDDNSVNRKILTKILSDTYELVEACNGKEALEILEREGNKISCVVLDLIMPEMDGRDFLRLMAQNEAYCDIPVLVATSDHQRGSEKECLELGACDFVYKPYDAAILRLRLQSIIGRSQLALLEQMRIAAEHDSLTGLYNRSKFYAVTRELIDGHPDVRFAVVRMDIDRFHLFNSFFGEAEGDRLLKYVANRIQEQMELRPYATYGRIESDVFCVCVPYREERVSQMVEQTLKALNSYTASYYIEPSFGVYPVDEPMLPVETMYARASEASRKCKGQYQTYLAYYDKSMTENAFREQEVMNAAPTALEKEQFVVYLQPKYNLKTGQPDGAEALARWNHPERGMISPGVFIPVFERNGFVGKLDYYMWEHVCCLLRKWMDEGLNPAPISVNISRTNMYNPKLVDSLVELVERYGIPPALLNLELTESAYMDNPDLMKKTVEALREKGFVIMMDDFGSGYSSLNTLKDILVDILKVDMKFLPTGENNGRSERILASVIRMAGWLNLPVIVEGVETEDQKNFLLSIGCGYVQGYYYARPMPEAEYEALLRKSGTRQLPVSDAENSVDISEMIWASNAQIERTFGSIDQPIAIYEYVGGELYPLRVNESFREIFGYGNEANDVSALYRQNIAAEDMARINAAASRAMSQRSREECEYYRLQENGTGKWFRVRFRFAQMVAEGAILFAVFTDISKEKRLEQALNGLAVFEEECRSTRKKLLIVDDMELSREILQRIFENHYEILEASNGEEALQLLRENGQEVAVILLDMIMPGMDGREFLQIKNQDPLLAGIPVVVISTENSETVKLDMLRLGVNDYVTKPFVPALVERRVENVLEYSGRFRKLLEEYRQQA